MNFTESLDHIVHSGTEQAMHTDTSALPTVVSAKDLNMLIWSGMEVIKAANLTGRSFNPDVPATYQVLLEAINLLIEARVGDFSLDTGLVNAPVVAMVPPVTSYKNGMEVKFRVAFTNTAATTLNAGGGIRPLVRNDGVALIAGDLPVDTLVTATYVSSINKFVIGSALTSQALSKAQADLLYSPLITQMPTTTVITATGTYTKKAGCKYIRVRQVGGGGGGSGYGAGGAGGYSEKIIDMAAINSVAVTIGIGGAVGVAGTTTTFGTHCTSTGGGVGINGGSAGTSHGGAGGVGSGGDFNTVGQSGGGGAATPNVYGSYGAGGSSMLGGGAYPVGGAVAGYGGGGVVGTTGGNGVVIVEEFYK